MPTYGPTIAGSGGNTGSGAPYTPGSASGWSSTSGNITADDGTGAISAGTSQSVVVPIYAHNFGFAIPSYATIAGVVATAEDLRVHTGGAGGLSVRYCHLWDHSLLATDARIGSDLGGSFVITATSAGTDTTFGSPTTTWGVQLTPAIVNSSNFGWCLCFDKTAGPNTNRVALDAMFLTIYTSEGQFRARARRVR